MHYQIHSGFQTLQRRGWQHNFTVDGAVLIFKPLRERCATCIVSAHQPAAHSAASGMMAQWIQGSTACRAIWMSMIAASGARWKHHVHAMLQGHAKLSIREVVARGGWHLQPAA
jgi:hypothetical protein